MELNEILYRKMYLIRKAEQVIIDNYCDDEMKTPMHMSAGEEAIAAGVCQALGPNDQILCTYRSHGIYLANSEETDEFFAELYGKKTGMVKGKSGSMHVSSVYTGLLVASAIVASVIPVAVGVAYANQQHKNKRVAAVFFGDGALDEGNFWESLNMACVLKVPLLFICEDNGFAVHTSAEKRHGYDSITEIVGKFRCNVFESNTTDVEKIYNLTVEAIKKTKESSKPSFIHFKYWRYLEHVGVFEDYDAGYRSREEYERWLKKDPVELQRKKLIQNGFIESKIEALEKEIDIQVESSMKSARQAEFPDHEELYKDLFA